MASAVRRHDVHLPSPQRAEGASAQERRLAIGLIQVDQAWDFEKGKAKPYPKGDAGVRPLPIEPEIEFVIRQLCQGLGPNDYLFPSLPPKEDWAATLREHMERAGLDRVSLYENTATVKWMTFYDLRATGITWRTLRGDDTREVQRAAGHEHYDTTDGYVRETGIFKGRVGTPFPALPEVFRSRFLITGGQDSRNGLFSAEIASPRGFEPLLQP